MLAVSWAETREMAGKNIDPAAMVPAWRTARRVTSMRRIDPPVCWMARTDPFGSDGMRVYTTRSERTEIPGNWELGIRTIQGQASRVNDYTRTIAPPAGRI